MDDNMDSSSDWEIGDPVFDKWLEQEAAAGNEEVAKSTTNSPIWGNPSTSHRYETDRKINDEFSRIWENARDSQLVRKVVPRRILGAVDEKIGYQGTFCRFRKTWLVSSLPASDRLRKHHTTEIFVHYLIQSVPLGCPIPRHLISHKSFRKLVVLRDLIAVPNQLSPLMTFPADHDRLSANVLHPTGVAPEDRQLAIFRPLWCSSDRPRSAEPVPPTLSGENSLDMRTTSSSPRNSPLTNEGHKPLTLQTITVSNLARTSAAAASTAAKFSTGEDTRSTSPGPGSSFSTRHPTDKGIGFTPRQSAPSLTAGNPVDNNLKTPSLPPTPSFVASKPSAAESMRSASPQFALDPQPAKPPMIISPKLPTQTEMPSELFPRTQDKAANPSTAETGTIPPTSKVSQQDTPEITKADLFAAMNPIMLRTLPLAIEGLNAAMREGLPMEAPKEALRRALLDAFNEALEGGPQSIAGLSEKRSAIQLGAPAAVVDAPLTASTRDAVTDMVRETMRGYQATFRQTLGQMNEVQAKNQAAATAQSSHIGTIHAKCAENTKQVEALLTKCAENENQVGDLKIKCTENMNQFGAVQAKCGQNEVRLAQQKQSEQINARNDAGIQNLFQMTGNLQMHERENIATVARLVGENKAQDEKIKEQNDKLKAQEMRIRARKIRPSFKMGGLPSLSCSSEAGPKLAFNPRPPDHDPAESVICLLRAQGNLSAREGNGILFRMVFTFMSIEGTWVGDEIGGAWW
ncbi:hypothetical protein B0T11DRAFT_356765 [Plectosphaerella cucumerina]|uniref:Uncharacterized protein n=1 Tax=Plectosphaerella cucumerina TaxID=40658 RepID=A0A8K0T7P1_9PEZI|nr:hypothetical protein B0T11DRAFT_356765 [Plectosphaerella cucumerina]